MGPDKVVISLNERSGGIWSMNLPPEPRQ